MSSNKKTVVLKSSEYSTDASTSVVGEDKTVTVTARVSGSNKTATFKINVYDKAEISTSQSTTVSMTASDEDTSINDISINNKGTITLAVESDDEAVSATLELNEDGTTYTLKIKTTEGYSASSGTSSDGNVTLTISGVCVDGTTPATSKTITVSFGG